MPPVQAQPSGSKSGSSHFLPIIVIGIIVVIVAGGLSFLLLGHHNANSQNSASTSTISNKATSIPATTTIQSNGSLQFFNGGGGPGQYYMSKNEMVSLTGSSAGNYSAFYQPNPTDVTGIYMNNITAYWFASYIIFGSPSASSNGTKSMAEFIIRSPKAKYLYYAQLGKFINATTEKILATNATTGGLTYSYVEYADNYSKGDVLFGYKGNYTVSVAAPRGTNQTRMASLVASDIP